MASSLQRARSLRQPTRRPGASPTAETPRSPTRGASPGRPRRPLSLHGAAGNTRAALAWTTSGGMSGAEGKTRAALAWTTSGGMSGAEGNTNTRAAPTSTSGGGMSGAEGNTRAALVLTTGGGISSAAGNTRAAPTSTSLGRSGSLSRTKKNGPAPPAQDPVAKRERESRCPPLVRGGAGRPAGSVLRPRPTSAGGGSASPRPVARGPSSAGHARARSTVTSLPPAMALGPVRDSSSAPLTPVGGQQQQGVPPLRGAAPRPRPAFSTLQQHYSPAKTQAPRPPTWAILAPPSPSRRPGNVAAVAETSKLQGGLLQLHLLHGGARAAEAAWRAAAEEKLGGRFREISRASKGVRAREDSALEGDNILSLRRWGARQRNAEDGIRVLGEVVTGLWVAGETGGRYESLVSRFERFLEGVSRVEEARRRWRAGASPEAMPPGDLFVEELGQAWRDDVAGLMRRVDMWTADFGGVCAGGGAEGGPEGSALGRVLRGVGHLLGGMVAEMRAMVEAESVAMRREEAWVEGMVRGGGAVEGGAGRGAGAVWRVL